ncbi:MAG: endospore germination permease [Firmicutes bacterium]|nr:endospore germination permease [Bacillota bacterium]
MKGTNARDEIRISYRQELLLMLNFLLANAFIIIPSAAVKGAKQDGWMTIALATVTGIGLTMLHTTLGMRYPRQTLVQYAQVILARVPGKMVGLLFMWFALHLGALVVRNFGDFMVITLMPETPRIVFHAVIMLVVVLALYGGLEVLCRFNEGLTFLVVVSIIFVLVLSLSIEGFDLKKLLPPFENGLLPVLKTSLIPITFPFGETVLFTMIIPYLDEQEKARRAHIVAMAGAGTLLTLITVAVVAVFGVTALDYLYPTHSLTRCISIVAAPERIDAISISVWILSGLIKIAVCLFVFVTGSAQMLNLKDYRPLLLPSGVIMTALSVLVYENIMEQIDFAVKVWPVYSLPFEVGIPLLLLAVSLVGPDRAA